MFAILSTRTRDLSRLTLRRVWLSRRRRRCQSQRNIIHGSDAVESAQREIALWFPEGVTSGPIMGKEWIYE